MKDIIKNIVIALLLIFAAALFWQNCKKHDKIYDVHSARVSIQDSLEKTRNELGQEVASKRAIEGDMKTIKNKLKSKDSLVRRLQNELHNRTHTATIAQTETTDSIITQTDTVYRDTTTGLLTYGIDYKSKWLDLSGTVDPDSVKLSDISIRNDIVISHEYKYPPWQIWKPDVVKVKVKNINPHTRTTDLQSYVADKSSKRKWANTVRDILIFGAGIGTAKVTGL